MVDAPSCPPAQVSRRRADHDRTLLTIPPASEPLRAIYTTLSATSIAALVGARYDLGQPVACQLLNRGFNDTYSLRMPDNRQYVARLSHLRHRGAADVAAETAFLSYLAMAGVPVAAPVPTWDGTLFTAATAPEGPRALVVFRHAEGRLPQVDAPQDAHAHGVTLARVHNAAESYPSREAGRYRLDLDHLLHRQLAVISGLDALSVVTRDLLAAQTARLSASVTRLDGLTWTRCHGDCHGGNARISDDGRGSSTATFFDFDDGGFGYLAYDLAVHLWAQVSFQRQRYGMWHAFIQGYRSVRAIKPMDLEAVHLFVPIRHIWFLGEYASRVAEWGSEAVPSVWLDRQAAFLSAWENERLSPPLLQKRGP